MPTLWALLRQHVHLLWHIARLDFHAAIMYSQQIRIVHKLSGIRLPPIIHYKYIGCTCGRCFLQRELTPAETALIADQQNKFRSVTIMPTKRGK